MPKSRGPKQRSLTVRWPMAGVNRRWGYQSQPPYTAPDALNVRPDGPLEGRTRGGSREGLEKSHRALLGSGNPVRMLQTVNYVRKDGRRVWVDNFEGDALGDVWTAASWVGTAPSILGDDYTGVAYNDSVGAVRDAFSDWDTSDAYRVSLYVAPYQGSHDGQYYIYARMDDTTPVATTDGVVLAFASHDTAGTYSGTLDVYASSVKTSYALTGGNDTIASPGWLTLHVSSDTVTVYWRGTQLLSQAISAAAGERIGFGTDCEDADGITLIDTFRVEYGSDSNLEVNWPLLVASANGSVYTESTWMDEFDTVTTDLALATDHHIEATEHQGKLYIADWGEYLVDYDDGTIDATGTKLDSASVADWTAIGANLFDYVCVIDAVNSVTDHTDVGTYTISALASGTLTLGSTLTANLTVVSFRVERGPKVYDPVADTLTLWTATSGEGQVPTGCKHCCTYRGRVVLAGAYRDAHNWYMSHQDDANDWDYDDTTVATAVAGNNATAGKIGEPVTALAPHNDDILVFGCVNSIWPLRGDPAYAGDLTNASHNVGMIAWCRTPNGSLMLLSKEGLYEIPIGPEAKPQPVSAPVLPRELRNTDPVTNTVSMAWSQTDQGIHVFVSPDDDRTATHWWFDWETKGFWPQQFQSPHEPTAVLEYKAYTPESTCVLLGGKDGYVRRFHPRAQADDGTAITSWCDFGPIRLWDDTLDGLLQEMEPTLAADSGDVTYAVRIGASGEAANEASTAVTGTWSAGRGYVTQVRRAEHSAILRLTGTGNRAWAFEHVVFRIVQSGRHRR